MADTSVAEHAAARAGRSGEWHWHPDLPIPTSPLFAWPPRPAAALSWVARSWLALSMLVLEVITASLVWALLQPPLERTATLAFDWIALMYLRNLALVFLVAGGLHLYFYILRRQGDRRRFEARGLARGKKAFLWGDQVRDNMFWTCASGVTVWTGFEVLYVWALANGHVPTTSFTGSPVWFVAWFLLIPIWSSCHFYWIHRALHWPPLYRLAHALHHKNVVIGPWSGISMHPIEHLLYFSSTLIHFVVASHPVHVFFHMHVQALNPAASHSGFDGLMVGGRKRVELGDFFHQLHHRYFECNFGTAEMPWDKWFGSFHDGTPQARKRLRARTAASRS
ncbi:MAG: sterol desaturase family protein [Kiloniellales bacterium]|nr:sterol desaturase family protein [Kiloniellales bacterium]